MYSQTIKNKTMKKNTIKLIKFLQKNGYDRNIYDSTQNLNNWYFDVNGYIDDVYFHFSVYENLHGVINVNIADTTDCRDLIEWLLTEFKIK